MQNLGNVYICGSPYVISRTDAHNRLYSIFKLLINYKKRFDRKSSILPLKYTVIPCTKLVKEFVFVQMAAQYSIPNE